VYFVPLTKPKTAVQDCNNFTVTASIQMCSCFQPRWAWQK